MQPQKTWYDEVSKNKVPATYAYNIAETFLLTKSFTPMKGKPRRHIV